MGPLVSLYLFTDNMDDHAIADNASFLKFSKTGLLIFGGMPKKVPDNKRFVAFTKNQTPIEKIDCANNLLRYCEA